MVFFVTVTVFQGTEPAQGEAVAVVAQGIQVIETLILERS
jgi:hypothetical protein